MGEIETVGAEKMGWLDLPRGTSYPTFPYYPNLPYFGYWCSPSLLPCLLDFIANDFAPSEILVWLPA